MEKIKTAVVGVGSLGQHHLKWLAQMPNSQLVGFYDTNLNKARGLAGEYNVTAFYSLEDLADKAEAVSVVVPTRAHFEVASMLLKNGCHCLIEKPVTSDLDQAVELQKIAQEQNLKVTVGHVERFNPAVRALAGLDINPSFIEAHRLARFDPRGTDVAVVLDLMIHDIDLALMLIESTVADIQASAVAVVSEEADIANARLTFENGAVANLTASRISLKPMRKLRIFQRSGYYSLDLAEKQADLYRMARAGEETEGMRIPLGASGRDITYLLKPDTGEDMLGSELGAFLDTIILDRPVAVPLAEATEALRVALEVNRIGVDSIAAVLREKPV